MSEAVQREPVLIKRYARNRFYDTAARCYRSVEQLRQWRTNGMAFSVVDTETGEDITRVLLA